MTDVLAENDVASTPKVFKLAVSGSRTIVDRQFIYKTLDEVAIPLICAGHELEIHLGDASGVDEIATDWARDRDLQRIIYFASREKYERWRVWHSQLPLLREGGTQVSDWDADGLKAGPLRNHAMINGCDELVAIWDGASRGTKNAIATARNQLVKSVTYVYPGKTVIWSENTRQDVVEMTKSGAATT